MNVVIFTNSFGTLSVSASGAGSPGFTISDTAGTVTVGGAATISNTGGTGLSVTGGATVGFQSLSLSGIGAAGIVLNAHNGSFTTTGGTLRPRPCCSP